MKKLVFEVKGTTPLMLGNPQTVNPFNDYAKAIKEITAKRKKTEEDTLELFRLKWLSSVYWNAEIGYYIPSSHFLKTIESAAKEMKMGKKIIQSLIIPEDSVLEFKHSGIEPKDLYNSNPEYIDIRDGVIQRARVSVVRMIVNSWKTKVALWFDENQLDEGDIVRFFENAGLRFGVGTYRQRYGKFVVKKL